MTDLATVGLAAGGTVLPCVLRRIKEYIRANPKFPIWGILTEGTDYSGNADRLKFTLEGAAKFKLLTAGMSLSSFSRVLRHWPIGTTAFGVVANIFSKSSEYLVPGLITAARFSDDQAHLVGANPVMRLVDESASWISHGCLGTFCRNFVVLTEEEKQRIPKIAVVANRVTRRDAGSVSSEGFAVDDVIFPVEEILASGIYEFAELLLKYHKHLDILEASVMHAKLDIEIEFTETVATEFAARPIDRVDNSPLIQQGINGMCRGTSLIMADCGLPTLPSNKDKMTRCVCQGPLGGCGKFVWIWISDSMSFSFIDLRLEEIMRHRRLRVKYRKGEITSESFEKQTQELRRETNETIVKLRGEAVEGRAQKERLKIAKESALVRAETMKEEQLGREVLWRFAAEETPKAGSREEQPAGSADLID